MIEATVTEPAASSVRGGIILCVLGSLALLWVYLFEWSLIDRFFPLSLVPIHKLVWVPFLACCAYAALLAARVRGNGLTFALPLAICAVTVALVFSVPFTPAWLEINFWWGKAARESIVQRIDAGDLKPNVSYNSSLIALGRREPHVSAGGNEIVVEGDTDGNYVLFFTFRGMPSNYSGFLYVPPGHSPDGYSDLADKPPRELIAYADNWYFVAQ